MKISATPDRISSLFLRQLSCLLILFSFAISFLPIVASAQQQRQQANESSSQPQAQEKTRQLISDEKSLNEEKRLALVIGNSAYKKASALPNPVNDATDVGGALRELGFEVMVGLDQTRRDMEKMIREFGDRLAQERGVGLFFYAGHGIQYGGKNYLIPVDADIPDEDEVDFQAVDANLVLRKMSSAQNRLNIVILDACRNNPFARSWRSFRDLDESGGLAKMQLPRGTLILYATEPGKVASDGSGRNGLFTESLLEEMNKPGVTVEEMFKEVVNAVDKKSNKKQFPWTEGVILGKFYMVKAVKPPDKIPPKPTTQNPPVTVKPSGGESETVTSERDKATREAETWNLVKNSADERDLRDFLSEFPDGANAAKAIARLEQIVWDSIKTANDKKAFRDFLNEFPKGAYSTAARIKLRQIEARETAETNKKETTTEPKPEVEPPAPSKKETVVKKEPVSTENNDEPKPLKNVPRNTNAGAVKTRKTVSPTTSQTNVKMAPRTNSVGMDLVYIPAGSFMMGSSERNVEESMRVGRKDYAEVARDWFDNEKPQRRVTIQNGFWIGKTEVTQAQWKTVMGDNPSKFAECGENCPVERVTWEKVKEFLQKLNEKNDGFEYRLPTEAEWEYAARAGTNGIFAGVAEEMMWHSGNSEDKTHPVAEKLPNAFGLYDMYGNVSEWTEDIYSPTYEGLPDDGSANTAIGDTKLRVIRGGSWNNFPTLSRSQSRTKYPANSVSIVIGFRVVAMPK